MRSLYIFFYYLLKKIKSKVNNNLVKFLVKYKLFNLLSILFIFSLKKIRGTRAKKKIKFKIIVLAKSGGVEDLVSSQKKYNKDILYLNCPRKFIFNIYLKVFNLNHGDEIKHLSEKEINNAKIKYENFLIKFLQNLKKFYKYDAFIGFNYEYEAEEDLHKACSKLNIPFLVIYKESVLTELENKYRIHSLKKKKNKFSGYKLALYSENAKNIHIRSNFIEKKNVEVVGCSRLSETFSYRKIKPKNQILYYVIENYRGLPNRFVNQFGNKMFQDLKIHKKYDPKFNWKLLHTKTIKTLKKFAKYNPEVSIIFKIKTGQSINHKEYYDLPENIKLQFYGSGHELIKESKIIIGWNSTALLEGIASNRFILLPYFHRKNHSFNNEKELNFQLSNHNYAFSENDLYKKLEFFMKKKYKFKKNNNNLFSLKFYLGNADNKSSLRLDKFIRKNMIWRMNY